MATQLREIEPSVEDAASEVIPVGGTDIVPAFAKDNGVVRFDEDAFNAWLRAKRDGAPTGLDMSKAKDRATVSSYVDKLRTERADFKRSKLSLTEAWREQTKLVNDAWSKGDEQIAAAIEEIAAPVTAWKEAEKARIAECEATITWLKDAGRVLIDDTVETVLARGGEVKAKVIDQDRFGALFDAATDAKKTAWSDLKSAYERLTAAAAAKVEADRVAARLAELEAEKVERERVENEAREAAEQAAAALKRQSDYASAIIRHIRECREARIDGKSYPWMICLNDVENRIETGARAIEVFGDRADEVAREAGEASTYIRQQMAEEAERHHKEVAERSAQDAREQAERERQEEREKEKAAAQAKIDAANERARKLEEAEEQRKADEAAEQQRIADREAEEQAERQRLADDRALQTRMNVEAMRVLVTFGITKEQAGHIIDAVRDGGVPHFAWEA